MKISLFKIETEGNKESDETFISDLKGLSYDNVSSLIYEGVHYNLFLEQKPRKNIIWLEELNNIFNFGNTKKEFGEISNAILLISTPSNNTYAISFGHSYHLIHEYCDRNFALDFAESEIKSADVDTKSSDFLHGIKIRELVNLKDDTTPTSESGESYKYVGGVPNTPIFGKRVDCGYSIHYGRSFKIQNTEDLKIINELIVETERSISKKEKLYKFPRISYLSKANKMNTRLNDILKHDLINNSVNIEIYTTSFAIVGSSVLMNSDNYSYEVYLKGKKKDTKQCFDTLTKNNIVNYFEEFKLEIDDIDDVLIKITKLDGEVELKPQSIKRYIFATTTYKETSYLLSDNRWGIVNSTFMETLEKNLEIINSASIVYAQDDLIVNYKDEDDYICKVVSSQNYLKLHKEFIYIKGVKFEIADLLDLKDNRLITVKLGKKNQEFIYSFDQAISAATFLSNSTDYSLEQKLADAKISKEIIENIMLSKCYCVLLGFEQKEYRVMIDKQNFTLTSLKSLLLKLKIVSWVNLMKSTDKDFKIILI